MLDLSVIILVRNEEKNIDKCLNSVKLFSEIIIIDDNSSDRTLEVAQNYKVTIYKRSLDNFSQQRNFALSKASNKWVLFLDADEIISDKLVEEIRDSIHNDNFDAYEIKREDIFLGKKMHGGDLKDVWLLRLGKKDNGKWTGEVHERWIIRGAKGRLQNAIIHNSHKNVGSFVSSINYYSTIRALELKKAKLRVSWISIFIYPLSKFIFLFVIKMGYLDGIHGFVHALLMSFHSFLVRSKLYHLYNEK